MPEKYGFGLRRADDNMWGVWSADDKAAGIWSDLQGLINTYGYDFDIIYASPWSRLFARQHYDRLLWWNGTQTSYN